ncbi:MAG TPA: xanthine dehydrogenase family protein molybdopterin-binding subunit [Gaiellaceae bacterium]|nr:xanthine dehydrogenase family protein molybdopterin-binding subunit [Gaiellaceae bacterium]
MTWVGRPVRRREDVRFLTGAARYLDDLEPEGALHVAFARSLAAHARIGGLDLGAALAVPGVAAILTGDDLADVGPLPAIGVEGAWLAPAAHPVLARGKVRYAGEAVALVAAESRAAAEDAAELVQVDYDPLEPVVGARTGGGVPVHDDVPDDVLLRWARRAGDPDAAFASAPHVVRRSYRIPRLAAAPMEPRGAIAEYDPTTDLLTVWLSAQDPHRPLAQLAPTLGRPPESIRVVVPDVGGAFGSKGALAPEAAAVAAAAIRLGRPLKWVEDRLENFLASSQGRGLEADVELALDGEGRMLALRARLLADLGAYLLPTTAVSPHTTAMLITGTYAIQDVDVEVVGVATTKVPTGPYRGAGRPEAAYLIERLVDAAARELGLDPLELRRRNFVREFPYRTAMGWTYDSGDYERCLDAAVVLLEPERWRDRPGRGRLGIGYGMYVERSGGLWESAVVRVEPDGQIVVRTGSSPHGQGHETTFAQIVADRLGVEPGEVEIRWGDSRLGPAGVGTFASRSTAMGGSALLAALDALDEERRRVGEELDVREAAARAGGLEASGRFGSELVFSSGAYGAAVELDEATGRLAVLRIAAVDDAGRIVNPLLAEGQVVGATVQGLGEALVEVVAHDETGQQTTASFADYHLLTAVEAPEIEAAFVETPSPLNPLGAKGIGEGGSIATPGAVANAVTDALGGAELDLPFTEEALWRALREGGS